MARNLSTDESKYNSARLELLLIIILTIINLLLIFSDRYYLFSIRISMIIAEVGLVLKAESGQQIYLVVAMIVAFAILIPFLLSYIFSKKHVGWMIVALVLFSVDTLLLLIDLPLYLSLKDYSIFFDLAVHVFILVHFSLGVMYGQRKKANESKQPKEVIAEIETSEQELTIFDTRELVLCRKKAFAGCAATMSVFIDGKEVCKLKNGETQTIKVPQRSFKLAVSASLNLVASEMMVEEGYINLKYSLQFKMGFYSGSIEIVKM